MTKSIGILTFLFCLAMAASGAATAAADHPLYGPPPAWVEVTPIPDIAAAPGGAAVQTLLEDTQARFGPDGDETYTESAVRLLNPQALAAMASISLTWNPDTQTVNLHRVSILRDGKAIDLLAGGKSVTVLRRETNLESAMLDGELTATIQPEGLRVGDILDIAVTTTRRDPVLAGRSEAMAQIRYLGLAGRVHVRELWPDAKPIRWRATEGFPSVAVTHSAGVSELDVDAKNLASPKPPRDAPARYDDVGQLETSQFQSWAEVSALMAPLYDKATRLESTSPLRAEAQRIARTAVTPKARAEAALRLAQDQIHYVFLGMNFGGYVPADADLTWTRRFGDCKGKTALLLSLLHALGVEAQPALVSTGLGDGLDQRLPMLSVFDHVMVRARIGGKTYWLDATRTGDRDLDETPPPDFHWVLPVQASGAALEKVEPPPFAEPAFESFERLDASAGYDAPAPAHVEHIFRGDTAVARRLNLDSQGRADAERSLREYWRGQISWIEPKAVDYAYDDERRVLRMTMEGTAKMAWIPNAGLREFDISDSNLGFTAVFKREPGPHADAPFSVDFPAYDKWTVEIRLPAGGADFRLAGAPPQVDQIIAGRRYLRRARLEGGVATMVAEEQSLAPEFPFSQADAASAALRDLSRYDVVVRGPPGPTLTGADDDDDLATPTDARGFEARGAGYFGRGQDDKAIADFTQAARLEPNAARHLYDRGAAYFHKGDLVHAREDFDAALRLDPADLQALMGRADLEFARGDIAHADADYAEALRDAPGSSTVLVRRAAANEREGRFEAAAHDYDAAAAAGTSGAPKRAGLLNAACFARAEWGRELEAGLASCEAALKLLPEQPDILDSEGLVLFRLGRLAKAIEVYDAALRGAPKSASSLFGRGLAEAALGRAAEAAADIATARATDPGSTPFSRDTGSGRRRPVTRQAADLPAQPRAGVDPNLCLIFGHFHGLRATDIRLGRHPRPSRGAFEERGDLGKLGFRNRPGVVLGDPVAVALGPIVFGLLEQIERHLLLLRQPGRTQLVAEPRHLDLMVARISASVRPAAAILWARAIAAGVGPGAFGATASSALEGASGPMANRIGICTEPPETGSPFSIRGRMRNSAPSFNAASPKPKPTGVWPITVQPLKVPALVTAQEIDARPDSRRYWARIG